MNIEQLKQVEKVYVFKGNSFAGELARTQSGVSFTYSTDYLAADTSATIDRGIAYAMPVSEKPYVQEGVNLFPFFAGLLPEGLRLAALQKIVKTSLDDLFSLLIAAGSDCIGDVTVALDRVTALANTVELASTDVSKTSFEKLFQESLYAHTLKAKETELSIAGVQPKISANRISFPISIRAAQKQYILKLSSADYPLLVENEHFFMQMAQALEIEVATTKIVKDRDGVGALLVERFDRSFDEASRIVLKIHQEDACQFLNRFPAEKYRLSFRSIAQGISQFSSTEVLDILRLLRVKVFSYIICNGDLHAKNISLKTDPLSQRISLAPFYDLLSTLPYGDPQMALELEGRKHNFRLKHFIAFGQRFGVPEKVVKQMVREICEGISPWIKRVGEIGFDDKMTSQLAKEMITRRGHLLN